MYKGAGSYTGGQEQTIMGLRVFDNHRRACTTTLVQSMHAITTDIDAALDLVS